MLGDQREPQASDIDPLAASVVDSLFEDASQNTVKGIKLEPWQREVIDKMVFLLVGYNQEGKEIDRKIGVKQIQAMERRLVIDPQEIQRDLALIANADVRDREKMSMQMPSFSTEGNHALVNSVATLFRTRYEGWEIIAGLPNDRGSITPVGSNYGLSKMPNGYSEGDHEFASLDFGTLALGTQARRLNAVEPHNTAINWRTSVLPSVSANGLRRTISSLPSDMTEIPMRRLGVASALKFIMSHVIELWDRDFISYNIGTIYPPAQDDKTEKTIRLRNYASFEHNKNLLAGDPIGEGYREYATPVQIHVRDDMPRGLRHFVGKILWFARQALIVDVQDNVEAPNSPLVTRGWQTTTLYRFVERITQQLRKEIENGDHSA